MLTTKRTKLIFDFEVFPEWWCCCTRLVSNPDMTNCITSDQPNAIGKISQLIDDYCLVGFNDKAYDLLIMYAIKNGLLPPEVYRVSEDIISNKKTNWTSHFGHYRWNWIDLYNDWRYGSLKMFEANQGMSIVESSVPFGTCNLTVEEKTDIIRYCHADTFASYKLYQYRKDYFGIHELISDKYDVPLQKAYQKTMQALAAEAMKAVKATDISYEDKDADIYVLDYIRSILDGVDIDFDVTDEDMEDMYYVYDGDRFKLGLGGIHSDYGDSIVVDSDKDKTIYAIDAAQYYPHLQYNFKLLPRTVSDIGRDIFKGMIDIVYDLKMHVAALEQEGRYDEAAAANTERDKYKVLINAVSGAQRNRWSKFYDPTRVITMCLVGQYFLIAIAVDLKKSFPGTEILQTNTDGIYVLVPNQYDVESKIKSIGDKFNFKFDVERARKLIQRNVNNYILIKDNGHVKTKGSWAYGKRNSLKPPQYPITHIAVFELMVHGTPIADTIRSCKDIMNFACCVKSGHTFEKTVYTAFDNDMEVNNTNRYVVSKHGQGTLYKIKDGSKNRFPDCPNNIILINDDISTYRIEQLDIDYDFYIDYANKLLPNFMYFNF